ncbi:hypothetical protein RRG08_059441 [Elysia crispata]|uniref:Uncharacterized protein n=1 Tax=Elysia crispata TaxID=231223 RepID=A0AAE1DS68_9GAST|nr:hypothetical protein RRG08_059441 [Elysia crispata]
MCSVRADNWTGKSAKWVRVTPAREWIRVHQCSFTGTNSLQDYIPEVNIRAHTPPTAEQLRTESKQMIFRKTKAIREVKTGRQVANLTSDSPPDSTVSRVTASSDSESGCMESSLDATTTRSHGSGR